MKDVILGLVGVGRIGVMHANNIAALNGVLNPRGIDVRLWLTDVAEDHARNIAAGLGAEFLPSVADLIASSVHGLVIANEEGLLTTLSLVNAMLRHSGSDDLVCASYDDDGNLTHFATIALSRVTFRLDQ